MDYKLKTLINKLNDIREAVYCIDDCKIVEMAEKIDEICYEIDVLEEEMSKLNIGGD